MTARPLLDAGGPHGGRHGALHGPMTFEYGVSVGQCLPQPVRHVWRGSFTLSGDRVLAGAASAEGSSFALEHALRLTKDGQLLLTQGPKGGQDTNTSALRRE